MSSRFSGGGGGGGPDYYNATGYGGGGGRSNTNNNFQSLEQQIPLTSNYRSPGIFLDQNDMNYHQISNNYISPPQSASLMGKRTLAEFQNQQQHQFLQPQQRYLNLHQNQALANLLMRSVKPRVYQNVTSPISPMDFASTPPNFSGGISPSSALLQQLRSAPAHSKPPIFSNDNMLLSQFQLDQSESSSAQQDSEQMMNRLHELEKQLLDVLDVESDAVSVITNNSNSEWSETTHNLIGGGGSSPNINPVSPSPSSSSCSSTVSSSPATSLVCSKQGLMEAASAIAEGKVDEANEILTRLMIATATSKPVTNSEQRLTEFLFLALKSRVNSVENPPPVAELYSEKHTASTQLLYDLSPCFKLGFMAANLAILDAIFETPNSNSFHVVDFDIGQGGQYMNLLHVLSARGQRKSSVVLKITAVADNENDERLAKVGVILSKFAEDVCGVNLIFNVVVLSQKLGDLSRDSLSCNPEEPLAVNFAFKLYKMPDESVSTENPRDVLLRRVKGLSPMVVTIIEQEMNTNTAPLTGRVSEVCNYYGALLDSIGSTVPRENPDRVKVEEGLSRRLVNSVACEGRQRIERCEVFGKWRARMGMAGFELKKMSSNVAESMRARLVSGNRVNPGFTVKEENGAVCFGWMGKTITVASAWR
jgi:hypothetical protein